MITIGFTYETITPESAEHGDFDDHGWYDPSGYNYSLNNEETAKDIAAKPLDYCPAWKVGALKAAIQSAQGLGISEPSDSSCQRGTWFSSVDADPNYQTGEDTYYSFHVDGVTLSTLRRIARVLTGKPLFSQVTI